MSEWSSAVNQVPAELLLGEKEDLVQKADELRRQEHLDD